MSTCKLVILDRDGVINHDSDNYIRCPDDYLPIESSLRAIAAINQAGIPVVVATNQSGVGRGYYTQQTLDAIHAKMEQALSKHGAHVDNIYFCPHTPDAGCDCRKPSPGMLQAIADDYPQRFAQALMVGDSWSDWQVAQAAQVEPYLVRTGKGERTLAAHGEKIPADRIFPDLAAITTQVLGLTLTS
jgi:D-glycero-D-manno-heptose 1,7-bisphosphate phosphatase